MPAAQVFTHRRIQPLHADSQQRRGWSTPGERILCEFFQMVQRLMIGDGMRRLHNALWVTAFIALLLTPAFAEKRQKAVTEQPWPELLLENGRKLTYQQTYSSER